MPLISRLESKYGRFAIPGLVQIIALFQLLVVFMMLFMAKGGAAAYQGFLDLDPDRIMKGEVWRLVSHVFIPRSMSLIGALFGTMIMMWVGRTLEEAWGAFRLNLYVFGWMFVITVGMLLFDWHGPISAAGLPTSLFLYQTLFFAFATMFPNEEISVFFILPIKVKWLAWLAAAGTAFTVMQVPSLLVPVLAAHLNYLVVFGPGFLNERARQAKVVARRSRFESAQLPQGAFFHQCSICKKTELDNPQLDFRVLDSGDEICSDCRAKRAAGTATGG